MTKNNLFFTFTFDYKAVVKQVYYVNVTHLVSFVNTIV
jgi:hypothetical protein